MAGLTAPLIMSGKQWRGRGGRPVRLTEVTGDGPLLDAVYTEVLKPSFPSDELISRQSLRQDLNDGHRHVATIVDDAGRPVAAAVSEWYPDTDVLLLGYLAVRPGLRGAGHGGVLLDHVRTVWMPRVGACVLLGEIEHPAAHSGSEAHGDPVARLRFYARKGVKALDLPYFQPALEAGGKRVYGLILALFALTEAGAGPGPDTVAVEPVRRFLTEYFTRGGEGAVGSDPETAALWRGLDRPAGIPVLPLDEPANIPVSRPATAGSTS
jgi:GNAT superfamily N-acetyltransferase